MPGEKIMKHKLNGLLIASSIFFSGCLPEDLNAPASGLNKLTENEITRLEARAKNLSLIHI